MALKVESASLLATFVEAALFGLFLTLFVLSCRMVKQRLTLRSTTRRVNVALLFVLGLMFTLATIHVVTSVYRIIDAFIAFQGAQTGQRLNDINNAGYITSITSYGLQTLLGDGFMIYRMYIVWDGRKKVCAPVVLLFLASSATGFACVVRSSQQINGGPVTSTPTRSDWAIAFFWLTLATNTLATGLIAGRLMSLHRRALTNLPTENLNIQLQSKRPHTAVIILVESGAIYSLSLIVLIGLYMSGSYAQLIVLGSMPQIMGIIFSIVIVRIALGITQGGHERAGVLQDIRAPERPQMFLFVGSALQEGLNLTEGQNIEKNGTLRGRINVDVV